MKTTELTPAEQAVIVYQGTERPFSGTYTKHSEPGTYLCRRCGAPLYRSSDKFDSGCGWPSFDDEINGAVTHLPDADGQRTEIVCTRCGGHLGHLFAGESFTPKNVRHCVNSISLHFVPSGAEPKTARAIFASGCFWGTQYYLQQAEGVVSTRVGYTGGHKSHPTYREVCEGRTGHAEAVDVEYDPTRTSFEKLARLFFETHDFSQLNRQGPDIGEQYRSEIFYLDSEQQQIANTLIAVLRGRGGQVATRVTPAGVFWEAEDYHQDYYIKKGGSPYCHRYIKRF